MPKTPNLQSDDYYEILGCERNADEAQLKKAYRKLAVKWHPDKNPDNDEATTKFQKISEAYATLSDKQKRQIYDQYGAEAANQMGEGGMPGGGFGFPGGGGGGGGVHHMSPDEAQAFFSTMFGESDPFGGMFGGSMGGGMGGPGMSFRSSMGRGGPANFSSSFGSAGGGMDPISMMLGGMGGMGPGMSMGSMGPGMSMGSMGPGMSMGGMGPGMSMGGMGPGMRSSMGSSAPPAKRFDAIPNGTVVSLKGLVNASDRNGDRGVVKQYIPSTGRYVVELEDSDSTMSVKPSNLLQHVHVRIHNVESKPEFNGKTGTIITWCPSKERYNVYIIALKKVVSLKPNNVVLETGTVAQVTGLASKPELNGKWGTIKEWIRESGRYEVQLSPQQIIRVKMENMRV